MTSTLHPLFHSICISYCIFGPVLHIFTLELIKNNAEFPGVINLSASLCSLKLGVTGSLDHPSLSSFHFTHVQPAPDSGAHTVFGWMRMKHSCDLVSTQTSLAWPTSCPCLPVSFLPSSSAHPLFLSSSSWHSLHEDAPEALASKPLGSGVAVDSLVLQAMMLEVKSS